MSALGKGAGNLSLPAYCLSFKREGEGTHPLTSSDEGSWKPSHILGNAMEVPHLFEPLTLRGVTFKSRIGITPMCQ